MPYTLLIQICTVSHWKNGIFATTTIVIISTACIGVGTGGDGGGVASDATGLYNIPSVSFTNAYNTSYAAFKQWLWQFRYPLFFDWKQRRKELCLIQNTLSFKATLDRQRSVISAECPDISTVINKE